MSKPRCKWWGFAKAIVRDYPARSAEYQELHRQSITSNLTAVTGGSVARRSTEDVALRKLPPSKQAEYDAVTKAIEQTRLLRTGSERLRIIDMVFWKKSHSLQGAALAANISYDTAINYHGDFLRLVGLYRGLCDPEDLE